MRSRKFQLVGDHSELHCGCRAVVDVIRRELSSVMEESADDYELLVVNGEGSMHHDTGPFNRKMTAIKEALVKDVEVWLINTVWQHNRLDVTDTLKRVTHISVRELHSRDDMLKSTGLIPLVFPDLALQADIDGDAEFIDLRGRLVTTDFYSREFSSFVRITDGKYAKVTFLNMKKLSWSSFVKSIGTARLLLTGRHHAVMAACKARTPFVAVAGNTHKIEGFLRTAKSSIPVCSTPREISNVLKWAEVNKSAYEELFDWVAELPAWKPGLSII